MIIKEEIKKEVIKVVDKFCKNNIESFEFNTEGSLTEEYKYMNLKNLNKVLDLCFEETYNNIINKITKINDIY